MVFGDCLSGGGDGGEVHGNALHGGGDLHVVVIYMMAVKD